MTIKPVLVPDHTANDLRQLMDHFATASTGPVKRQLTESVESGVTEGVNYTDELRDKMQWLMTTHHMRSGEAEEAAYYDEDPATLKGSPWEDEYTDSAERLSEFAPSDSGDGGGDDDGFDEDTLRKLAAQWFAGDEDPQVERLLAAAGWEIGQDEGYDDEPGVFVVQSGDADGRSYISWPAAELRSDVAEATMSRAAKGYEKYGREGMAALAKAGREGRALDPVRDRYNRYDETAEAGVTEARPDVMRHTGDKTIRVVKRGGKPIGEIGIDAEASAGNGPYYVKLYDGSYDAAGFDTAEEALAELRYAIKSSMSEGVAEAGAENNPVINAITRRIMLQRTDLLSKYGPEQVGAAVDEVADFVGDVEEIGSSDVSGWVRHVEQMLGNMEPGVTEQQVDELSPKTLGSYIKKSSADAAERQGDVTGRNQFGKGAEFAVKAFYGDQIQPNPQRNDPKIAKRQAGVDQAVDRLTAEDVAAAFKPGDRVMYAGKFATVIAQDGDTYGIRVDAQPGTMMVPVSQIKKPSYDESVTEGIDPIEQLRADILRFSR